MPSTELRVQQWLRAIQSLEAKQSETSVAGSYSSPSSSDEAFCLAAPFVDWLLITGDVTTESTSTRHKSRRAMSQHQVRSILKFVGVKPQLATEACNAVFNMLLCATLGIQMPLSPCNERDSTSTFSTHEQWEKALSSSHVKAFRHGEVMGTSKLRSMEALEALTLADPDVDLFLVLPFAALLHVIRDVLRREKIVGALNLRGPISSEIAAAARKSAIITKITASAAQKTTGASRNDDGTASASPLNLTRSLLQHDHRILFATKLQQHKTPLIIFVGGTSGCGKSTLAHLLANRLGISTVISTDGLREILRGHRDRDQAPELFASTYEAHLKRNAHQSSSSDMCSMTGASSGSGTVGGATPSSPNPTQLLPPIDKRVIDSFVQQSSAVLEVLDEVLTQYIDRCEAVLVEGVHLLPSFCIQRSQTLADKGVLCIPLFVHIVNREKHLLRFAIRAKSMTLKPKENKYVAHFAAIRQIQGYIEDAAAKSDLFLVNNTNVDKSLSAIHYVVLRSVDLMSDGRRNATNGSFTPSSPETSMWSSVKGKQMVEVLMRRREEKRSRRTRSAEPPASQQQLVSTLPKISVGEIQVTSDAPHSEEEDEHLSPHSVVVSKEKATLSVSDVVYRRSPGTRSPARPMTFHQPARSHSADAQLSRGRKSRDRQPRSIIPGVDDADDDGEGCEEEYGTTEGGKTAKEVLIEASRMKHRHTGESCEQRDDSIDDEEREEDAPSLMGS